MHKSVQDVNLLDREVIRKLEVGQIMGRNISMTIKITERFALFYLCIL